MLAYVCGGSSSRPTGGRLWRGKLTPFLHSDLGHRVCDPAEDEKKNLTLACADGMFTNFDELKRFLLERYARENQAPLWRV